jgi:cytoskeletal protein CcmA (bactofilin family)
MQPIALLNREPLAGAVERDESPAGTRADTSGDLLLGPGTEFDGKLTFQGTVRIDSRFKGSITTRDVLIVGARARVEAEITCGAVIVEGELRGNVRASDAVELRQGATVHGDVETPSLVVERGAFLQGSVRMPGRERAL